MTSVSRVLLVSSSERATWIAVPPGQRLGQHPQRRCRRDVERPAKAGLAAVRGQLVGPRSTTGILIGVPGPGRPAVGADQLAERARTARLRRRQGSANARAAPGAPVGPLLGGWRGGSPAPGGARTRAADAAASPRSAWLAEVVVDRRRAGGRGPARRRSPRPAATAARPPAPRAAPAGVAGSLCARAGRSRRRARSGSAAARRPPRSCGAGSRRRPRASSSAGRSRSPRRASKICERRQHLARVAHQVLEQRELGLGQLDRRARRGAPRGSPGRASGRRS